MRLFATGLHFHYRADRPILTGVDFSAEPGRLTLLIGPNGAGKSTLLKILAGLLAPQAGRVQLENGEGSPWAIGAGARLNRELARRLAYLPQAVESPEGYRVEEVVGLGRFPHQRWWSLPSPAETQLLREALEQVGAESLWGRVFTELSGGEQQAVLLASVLAQAAPVLLLDEPGKALDIHHQAVLFARLHAMAAAGKTVVAITHDLNIAARFADYLALLHNQAILATGTAAEVLTETRLRASYGPDLRVVADPVGGGPIVLPIAEPVHAQ